MPLINFILDDFQEAEEERLGRINAVTLKSDVHVSNVQEEQVKQKEELLENTIKKVDTVSEKREQKLQELKDKLKAREEHAAKVRLRKKLHIPTQEEIDKLNEQSEQLVTQTGVKMVADTPASSQQSSQDPEVIDSQKSEVVVASEL